MILTGEWRLSAYISLCSSFPARRCLAPSHSLPSPFPLVHSCTGRHSEHTGGYHFIVRRSSPKSSSPSQACPSSVGQLQAIYQLHRLRVIGEKQVYTRRHGARASTLPAHPPPTTPLPTNRRSLRFTKEDLRAPHALPGPAPVLGGTRVCVKPRTTWEPG